MNKKMGISTVLHIKLPTKVILVMDIDDLDSIVTWFLWLIMVDIKMISKHRL